MTLKHVEFTRDSLKKKNDYKFEKISAARGNPTSAAMITLVHFLYATQRTSSFSKNGE